MIWLARLRARLDRHPFLKRVTVLAGGTAMGQVLIVASSPLLTRLYGPPDLGLLAVYTAVISVPAAVTALRYDMGIPLPPDDRTAANLLGLAVATSFVVSVGIGAMLWLAGEAVARCFQVEIARSQAWLFGAGLLGVGAYQALSMWAVRKQAFAAIARTRWNQSVALVVGQLGFGAAGIGGIGLLFADLIGRFTGIGTLAALAWRGNPQAMRAVRLGEMRAAASRYRRFPLYSSSAAVINSLHVAVAPLLLAALYGASVAGWFALAQRVVGTPLTLVTTSVGQVYTGASAEAAHRTPERLPGLLWKVIRGMSVVAVPYAIGIALVARALVVVVFGQEWETAGVYMQVMVLASLFEALANPTGGVLDILERQDLHLVREVTRLTLVVGAVLVAKATGAGALTAVGLLSVGGALSYLCYLGISVYAVRAHMAARGLARAGGI